MSLRLARTALISSTLLALTAGCVHAGASTPPDPATVAVEQTGVVCSGAREPAVCQTLRTWAQTRGLPQGQPIPVRALRTDSALWQSLPGDARDDLRTYQWIVVDVAPSLLPTPLPDTRLASAPQQAAQGLHPIAAPAASSTSGPASCQRCHAAGSEE